MSLWSNTDNLAGTPKFVARTAFFVAADINDVGNTIDIKSSGTGFNTGDQVYYSGDSAAPGLYYVRVITAGIISLHTDYDGSLSNTNIVDLVAGTGSHTLQGTGVTGDITAGGNQIIFVDAQEAQVEANKAKGLTGAGWWRYQTYTDAQSTTRHKAECLVAMAVAEGVAGDAEDTIAADLVITISGQPAPQSVTEPAAATFSVTASINGAVPLTYQWQIDDGALSNWANVPGATSSSYTIDPTANATDNGFSYRVVVSGGGVSVTSSAALLTVGL